MNCSVLDYENYLFLLQTLSSLAKDNAEGAAHDLQAFKASTDVCTHFMREYSNIYLEEKLHLADKSYTGKNLLVASVRSAICSLNKNAAKYSPNKPIFIGDVTLLEDIFSFCRDLTTCVFDDAKDPRFRF